MNPLNPLDNIRLSCERVVQTSQHCKICQDVVETIADSIMVEGHDNFCQGVEWDACGWHYSADVADTGNHTCQYIFVLDSLNFCFWPIDGLEYDFLASKLKHVLEKDITSFDASRLATLTSQTMTEWFDGIEVPLLAERVQRLRELGHGLLIDFDGLAMNVVRKAEGSASRLVELILMHFPGFRDTSIYKGGLVHFYKRAQILVGDIWAAYGRPSITTHPCYFSDIDRLTMFADYRVPQILREMGILRYAPALAEAVDAKREIPVGSEQEQEIRACTVVAVDYLQKALLARGMTLLVIEVDWWLWQKGEAVKDTIAPHHRTLTIYY